MFQFGETSYTQSGNSYLRPELTLCYGPLATELGQPCLPPPGPSLVQSIPVPHPCLLLNHLAILPAFLVPVTSSSS